VPRVTLTFPALEGEMLFLVSGEDKRDILARVVAGEDLPRRPRAFRRRAKFSLAH
jgi:6-phosphogluconolactonase